MPSALLPVTPISFGVEERVRVRIAGPPHGMTSKEADLLTALPANIAQIDASGSVVACNEAWLRFVARFGMDGAIGKNFLDACDRTTGQDAAGASKFAAGVRAVLSGASVFHESEHALGARWYLLTVTPLLGDLGGGAAVMHQDVTERIAGETALRVSESRFRHLTDSIRDVFFLMDADGGRQLYVSPAYEEIWGRSCASAYASPAAWTDAIHPDDRASALDEYLRGMVTGRFGMSFRIVRPDGTQRMIRARCFPVLDETGALLQVAGVAEDVTEEKFAKTKAEAMGVLALFAAEPGFFGDEEMPLLTELTGDIDFAIDRIDTADHDRTTP